MARGRGVVSKDTPKQALLMRDANWCHAQLIPRLQNSHTRARVLVKPAAGAPGFSARSYRAPGFRQWDNVITADASSISSEWQMDRNFSSYNVRSYILECLRVDFMKCWISLAYICAVVLDALSSYFRKKSFLNENCLLYRVQIKNTVGLKLFKSITVQRRK